MTPRFMPATDDVLVRLRRSEPTPIYELGTPFAPAQFTVRTRDEAVSQVLTFAKRQKVRAWFADGDTPFVLLGTFRVAEIENLRT
jgi:hypothetical protein